MLEHMTYAIGHWIGRTIATVYLKTPAGKRFLYQKVAEKLNEREARNDTSE